MCSSTNPLDRGHGPLEPSAEAFGISAGWLRFSLNLLRRKLGDEGARATLAAMGETRELAVLCDAQTWLSFSEFEAIAAAAAAGMGGPEALLAAGELMLEDASPGGVLDAMHALGSADAAFAVLPETAPTFSNAMDFASEAIGDGEWLVTCRLHDGIEPFPEMCAIALGELRAFPQVYGYGNVEAVEEQCQVDGASACIYRVSWDVTDETARRERFLGLRARVIEARVGYVQNVVAELAGADHEAALHKIVAGFAVALLAPTALLVSEDPHTGIRTVRASGIDQAGAEAIAADIDSGRLRDEPTLLVCEVISARAHHGYLAAMGPSLPQDAKDACAIHARIAATALDLVVAMNEANRQARAAKSMAALSTELAEIVSPDETAARLVVLAPAITDCEQALVFLPEQASGRPTLSAACGYDDDAVARVHARLASLTASDPATAIDQIDDCLTASGVHDALVEPIGSHDEPIGWICVSGGEGTGGPRWRSEARLRVRGVAAQAATAISNSHLLDQIRHQALHDGLTGLPNRTLILDRFQQMLTRGRRGDAPIAVLFLDLDGFKEVNDTYGHEAGDELLRAVAARLVDTVRDCDVVGRMGGDEFVVLSESATHEHDPDLIAERILATLGTPYFLESAREHVRVGVSIGSTRSDDRGPAELLRDADLGLYEAKRRGKNRHVRFESLHRAPGRSGPDPLTPREEPSRARPDVVSIRVR